MSPRSPESADSQPRRAGESGQALLELALVTPVLILLITAIVQFAFILQSQVGLTNAVREAARRVATTPGPTTAWTVEQLEGDGTPGTGLLAENIPNYIPSLLEGSPAVTFCSYDLDSTTHYRVDVSVTYNHPVFFGLLGFATDFVDGTPDQRMTLTASTQMRLENDPAVAPGACS